MAKLDNEQIEQSLNDTNLLLRVWEATKNTDAQVQIMREKDMVLGSSILEQLIYGVQPERQIQLTIGDKPIQGDFFQRHARRKYNSAPLSLNPGDQLMLSHSEELFDNTISEKRLYVGNWLILTSVILIATTIGSGGKLSVIEADK
jgi:hypothetical protein